MNKPLSCRLSAILPALLLSACAALQEPPPPPPPPPPPAPVAEIAPRFTPEQLLDRDIAEAVKQFEERDFETAIRGLQGLLGSPDATAPQQVRMHKYLAFSQCSLQRRAPCQQHFESALKIDPTFQLTQAESGHPIWDPVFKKARTAANKKAKPVKAAKTVKTEKPAGQ